MLSLTFAIDTVKPSGPLAGLSGLSSMSLIGGVPLVGEFAETPEIPKASPAWTFESPALGDDAGWWLQLVSKDEMGTGRWPQVQLADESPVSNSLDTTINYDTSQEWRWSSWVSAATANFISETQWAYAGAWSELMSAQPSADPYYLGARNPAPQLPGNSWEGDFLQAFDNALMARIRSQAMGQEQLPLFSGSLPIYGNGNQTLAQVGGEVQRAAVQVVEIVKIGMIVLEQVPGVREVSAVVRAGVALANGDYVGLAINALGAVLPGGVNRIAAAFGVSLLPTAARLAINFITGAAVQGGLNIARQTVAIARGEQTEYDIGQTIRAAALGGVSNAMFAQTCFTGDMPLRVKGGSKRADEIREGDKLLSQNELDPNSPVEERAVEEVFVRVSPVLNVHVGGQIIRTTGEHPFFVVDKGWLAVEFMEIGDLLQTEDKRFLPVEGVADSGEVETVYNFRIAEYHTYFVGCDEWGFSVWAHNWNCATAKAKGFPGIGKTKNGGPTFKGTSYLKQNLAANQKNSVSIVLTGSRRKDFREANRLAGFKGDKAPKGYTWHHVDNFNPSTGRATLQLVKRKAHQATYPHSGSVAQYEAFHGVTYLR